MDDEGDRDDGFRLFGFGGMMGEDRSDDVGDVRSSGPQGESPAPSVIDRASALESECAVERAAAGSGSMAPAVPKPPTDVDWVAMFGRYADGRGWEAGAELDLIRADIPPGDPLCRERAGVAPKEPKPDTDFFEGDTTLSVANVEAIVRPISVALIAAKRGRIPSGPVWSPEFEARLERVGVFHSGSVAIHSDKMTVYSKAFHVHWRYFLFVALGGMKHRSEAPDDGKGYGLPILGYHYYAMDQNSAITNKCF